MNRLGLVLAGGGGKGSYQIGVWKAFREFGFDKYIYAISGTSVGALNACLIYQNDYEKAEKIWLNEVQDKILSFDAENLVKSISKILIPLGIPMTRIIALAGVIASSGIFSRDGLLSLIDKYLDFDYLLNTDDPLYAACLAVQNFNVHYFSINKSEREKIRKILLATSAIPFVFDKEVIDGTTYIDGGIPIVGDNIPIRPLYDLGCNMVVVVHLSRESIIKREEFPNLKIIEIVPQEDLGGLIKGTLNFSSSAMSSHIEQGYNDAKRILKPVFDMAATQFELLQSIKKMYIDEQEYKHKMKLIKEERHNIKNDIQKIAIENNIKINYTDDIKKLNNNNNKNIK
ncbi:patatin-like phospholipase family protein [Brachyspira innocens]|uniref:Patatin-like phospholipase family protein n=1 Tax=Brachyspira innocens TaxID=13264 RepID=A0ABT8YZR5_9SPIR|nr:patatin-like phospholipase family protein [Brachyspira innocens]MDO6995010.1 patatin-like phospholipase family protein [Brachyspira innocens]MDO7021382.1 patatin-like phospholipase family protein [Brachyspira innocens]